MKQTKQQKLHGKLPRLQVRMGIWYTQLHQDPKAYTRKRKHKLGLAVSERDALVSHKVFQRRTWAYCMPPKAFDVSGCSCGNRDTQWSEFENHLWCDQCQKNFIPEHYGILDGPIPVHLAEIMGIRFDRVIIETGEVERFNKEMLTWEKESHYE